MLTHEILKPLTRYGRGHVWQFGAPVPQNTPFPVGIRAASTPVGDGKQNGRIWHPGTDRTIPPMDKLAYAKWVEGPDVKQRFKVGKMVTLASSPVINGQPPVVAFLIDHIAEIHIQVLYDVDTKEPRCIGIKPKMAAGVVMYPPSKLRPLTEEEEQLVHLRDQEAITTKADKGGATSQAGGKTPSEEGGSSRQQSDTHKAVLGGEAVVIDRTTGEILPDESGNEGYSG